MEYIIKSEEWKLELKKDSQKYYIYIPFECDPEVDTILEFIDSEEYIQEHKNDFDTLNNGESDGKVCIISADKRPSCDMKVDIKTVDEAGGRVMYDKQGNPEYIPPESNDFAGLANMFGAMGEIPEGIQEIIEAEIKKD